MFKVLEGATAPTRATRYSACVDLYANADVVIGAGETKIVPLGVKILPKQLLEFWITDEAISNNRIFNVEQEEEIIHNFLKSHFLELHPRSSLRAKGLIIGVGVIDLDYPDELGLIVHNPLISANNTTVAVRADTVSITPNLNGVGTGVECRFIIKKHDKIAQCTLMEHKGYLMCIESDVERKSGFGSTGK